MNASLTNYCSFFGHREICNIPETSLRVEELVTNLIVNKGVSVFYFGGLGEFDNLCYNVVNKLKSSYSIIKTAFCYTSDKDLARLKRQHVLSGKQYDSYAYFPLKNNYWYYKILFRNYEIINASDYVVFYVDTSKTGGALSAYKYAIKTKKIIYNVK